MKALVLEQYSEFSYTEVVMPNVAPDEVLVRVHSCGICGSDIHGMTGITGRRIPPIIMGHEASGTLVDIGSAVKGWQNGDRVTFDSTLFCGECWYCRRGEINLCDNRRVLGVSCAEYRQHGAFAEYVCVPARVLYRLPDAVTFEQGALVEPLSIAVHAVTRAQIKIGESAVVIGTGMIGLLLIQVLRAAGCMPVIAVDLNAERLKLAAAVGAAITLRSDST
ncbi:MAG: alcohol dehydrogenase catalytic domain-containing protein, partial [Anaerolinea sp.]|nr:alcohol dehydrogenase catalytic domain-containing protein [Anaerolinea sp.]